jgi:hypothetical protein
MKQLSLDGWAVHTVLDKHLGLREKCHNGVHRVRAICERVSLSLEQCEGMEVKMKVKLPLCFTD